MTSLRPTIEDLAALTVRDCKRMGYLRPGPGLDCFSVPYRYRGELLACRVALKWKSSNLKRGCGYYYFICPVTGLPCRKLYLYGGRFVSRQAIRALYGKQRESKRTRRAFKYYDAIVKAEGLTLQKNRRERYRGRLTPYGRKLQKLCNFLNVQRADE